MTRFLKVFSSYFSFICLFDALFGILFGLKMVFLPKVAIWLFFKPEYSLYGGAMGGGGGGGTTVTESVDGVYRETTRTTYHSSSWRTVTDGIGKDGTLAEWYSRIHQTDYSPILMTMTQHHGLWIIFLALTITVLGIVVKDQKIQKWVYAVATTNMFLGVLFALCALPAVNIVQGYNNYIFLVLGIYGFFLMGFGIPLLSGKRKNS